MEEGRDKQMLDEAAVLWRQSQEHAAELRTGLLADPGSMDGRSFR